MTTLFETKDTAAAKPLADRLRPRNAAGIIGQAHVLSESHMLRAMLEGGAPVSLVLWGPPGCGKTTLARIIADKSGYEFEQVSAVASGVAELKAIFERARTRRQDGMRTLVFVDEIHRFNRAQQDAFLPVVEDGTIILIGATTENPSFEMNGALLSRTQVLVLRRLDDAALETLLERAEAHYGTEFPLTDNARASL